MKRILTFAVFALFGLGSLMADQPEKSSKEAPESAAKRNVRQGKAPRRVLVIKRQKQLSYLQFLPTFQDLYAKELAQIDELKKSDPKAASSKLLELHTKFRKQKMAEMRAIRVAVSAYKAEKDEAKLVEVKKLIGEKVDEALANAKAKLEASRQELEQIKQRNINRQKFAAIERLYQHDFRRLEGFIKSDREQLINAAADKLLNAPEQKFRGHKKDQGKAKKAEAKK